MIRQYIDKAYFTTEYKSYLAIEQNDIFSNGKCSFSFDYIAQMASEAINDHMVLSVADVDKLLSEELKSAIKYATAMLVEHYVVNGTNFRNADTSEGLNGDTSAITFLGDFNPSHVPTSILNKLANYGLYSEVWSGEEYTEDDITFDYLVEDKDILITSDPKQYPILGSLPHQKDFNELVEREFENGDINAKFGTEVNNKNLRTVDGQIKFHSKTQPTTLYSLVEESKLLNLFKEYTTPEDMVKDSIYFDYGTITGGGFFGDGTSTNTQRTKAEDIISEFASFGNGVTDLYAITADGKSKSTVAIDANAHTINFDGLVEEGGTLRFNKLQWDVSDAAYEQVYIDTDGTTKKDANGINKHNIENVEVAETARVTDAVIDTSIKLNGKKITDWSDILPTPPDLTPYLKIVDLEAEGDKYFADNEVYRSTGDGKLSFVSKRDNISAEEVLQLQYDRKETGIEFRRKDSTGKWRMIPYSNMDNPWPIDIQTEGKKYFANKLIYEHDGAGKIRTNSTLEAGTNTEKFEISHIDSQIPSLLIETDNAGNNPTANFFNTKVSVETDKDNGLSPVNVNYYNQNKSTAHKYNNIYTVKNLAKSQTTDDGAAKIGNKYWTFDDEVTNQFETIGGDTNTVQVPRNDLYFPKNDSGVEDLNVQVAFKHQALIDKKLITDGYNIHNIKLNTTELDVTQPMMVVSEAVERDTANGDKEFVSLRYEYKYGAEIVDNGSEFIVQLNNRVLYTKYEQASSTAAQIKVDEGELYISDGKVYIIKTTVR